MPQYDSIQATPRNALLGMVADYLGKANSYAQRQDRSMPMNRSNPMLSLLADGVGLGDMAATADRASYGLPLTSGAGQATQMLPETRNSLMSLGPIAAKYPMAAGKAAMALGTGGADAGMAAQRAAIVWHGSPHKFDAFDASKIGTGEGAQAYGHGLYLAENPAVAQAYKQALSPGAGISDSDTIARVMEAVGGKPELAAAELRRRAQYANIPGGKERLEDLAKKVESGFDPSGSVYKVDLPDDKISRMLDWDKPLSQQALGVQEPLAKMFGPKSSDLTGQEIYKKAIGFDSMVNVASKTGGNEASLRMIFPNATDYQIQQAIASSKNVGRDDKIGAQMLRNAGIPGIRYLDGGSRGAGAGSSNFVVFPGEEQALRILERNGQKVR